MGATSARGDGAGPADAAPKVLERAENGADAAPNAAGQVNTAEVARNQAETTGVVDAEEAEHRHRALMLARIRLSSAPGAVKEKFASVAETAKDAAAVEACLKAVEEALPDFLRENRAETMRREHPAGDVFFRGNAEEITEEQAEEVARRQLERSGLLRGQRVRVAD